MEPAKVGVAANENNVGSHRRLIVFTRGDQKYTRVSSWGAKGKGGPQYATHTCGRLSDCSCSTFSHSSLLQTYRCDRGGLDLGIQTLPALQVPRCAPIMLGWKRTSGTMNRSVLSCTTWSLPSSGSARAGNKYVRDLIYTCCTNKQKSKVGAFRPADRTSFSSLQHLLARGRSPFEGLQRADGRVFM
jgi:hypothetical protein